MYFFAFLFSVASGIDPKWTQSMDSTCFSLMNFEVYLLAEIKRKYFPSFTILFFFYHHHHHQHHYYYYYFLNCNWQLATWYLTTHLISYFLCQIDEPFFCNLNSEILVGILFPILLDCLTMCPPAVASLGDLKSNCTDEELFLSFEKMISGSQFPSNVITYVNPFLYMPSYLPGKWYVLLDHHILIICQLLVLSYPTPFSLRLYVPLFNASLNSVILCIFFWLG